MSNSLSVDELSDGVSWPCKQLLNGVKNTIVEVEKTMLQIMPDIMQAQFMGICSLPAMITKVPNEWLITVFTNNRMVLVGHLCLFAIVAYNVERLSAVWIFEKHLLNLHSVVN